MKWRTIQTSQPLSDEECLKKYKDQHDLKVLGVLFDRYVPLIFGTCVKYLRDPVTSEDITMELFEVLADKLKSHEVSMFRSWLYIVTRNHCLQYLRSRKKVPLTEDYEDDIVQLQQTEHPDDEFDIQQTNEGLMQCIQKLPDAQKQSIELFYFQSKTYQEIAELMSQDKEQIRSHLQNGRRNLRICMNDVRRYDNIDQ